MRTSVDRLDVEDITGAWAIIPTPAVTAGDDWRTEDSVDYDEVSRAVAGLIEAGVDGIMCQGTFGEGATLTWEEKRKHDGGHGGNGCGASAYLRGCYHAQYA